MSQVSDIFYSNNLFSSPSPIIPFFLAFVPIFSRGNACYAGKFFCLITRVANRTQSNSNRSIDFAWGSLIFFFLNPVVWAAGGIWVGGGALCKKIWQKNIPGVPGYPKSTALRALRYPLCPIILWLLTAWNPFSKTVMNPFHEWLFTDFLTATPETAFLHAVSAAAITYELTLKCRYDIAGCSCVERRVSNSRSVKSGCADNVEYGMEQTRRFFDEIETGNDARTAMNRHNNRVGREVRVVVVTRLFGLKTILASLDLLVSHLR